MTENEMTENEKKYEFVGRYKDLTRIDVRDKNLNFEKMTEEFAYFMSNRRTRSDQLTILFDKLHSVSAGSKFPEEKYFELLNLGLNNPHNSIKSINRALSLIRNRVESCKESSCAEYFNAVKKCIDMIHINKEGNSDAIYIIEELVAKEPGLAKDALNLAPNIDPYYRNKFLYEVVLGKRKEDPHPDLVLRVYNNLVDDNHYHYEGHRARSAITREAIKINQDIAKEELKRVEYSRTSRNLTSREIYEAKEKAQRSLNTLIHIIYYQPELAMKSFCVFEDIIHSSDPRDSFVYDSLAELVCCKPELAEDIFKTFNGLVERTENMDRLWACRALETVSRKRPELNNYVLDAAEHFLEIKDGLQDTLFSIIDKTPEHADKAISLIGKSLTMVGWKEMVTRYFDEDDMGCGPNVENHGRGFVHNDLVFDKLLSVAYRHPEYAEKVFEATEKVIEKLEWSGRFGHSGDAEKATELKRSLKVCDRKLYRDTMRKKMEVARKKEIKEAAEGNVSGEKGKVNPKQSKLKKLGLALRLNLIKSDPKYR